VCVCVRVSERELRGDQWMCDVNVCSLQYSSNQVAVCSYVLSVNLLASKSCCALVVRKKT